MCEVEIGTHGMVEIDGDDQVGVKVCIPYVETIQLYTWSFSH